MLHRRGGRRDWLAHLRFDIFLAATNASLRLPGHRLRLWILRTIAKWEVAAGCTVERGLRIRGRGGVRIGAGCNINRDVLMDGGGTLSVGSLVNVSPEVLILTTEHDPQSPDFAGRQRSVSIGDRVWLASRAVILPGSTIGDGVLVAAGAVVRGDVEAWRIVAGNPAEVVGTRSPEAQETLAAYRRFWH